MNADATIAGQAAVNGISYRRCSDIRDLISFKKACIELESLKFSIRKILRV